jgi:aryl-alcohol dehydrogenase-like predicted oxidoreductase
MRCGRRRRHRPGYPVRVNSPAGAAGTWKLSDLTVSRLGLLIAAALAPYPDDLVIVTKVGPGRDPWGEWYSARPDQLRGQVEENLRQLGRDHLDVVNLRRTGQQSVAEHFGALPGAA